MELYKEGISNPRGSVFSNLELVAQGNILESNLSKIPERQQKMSLIRKDIDQSNEDNTDVSLHDMLDGYKDRLDGRLQCTIIAKTMMYYYVQSQPKQETENDSQSVVQSDLQMDSWHSDSHHNKIIPLMLSKKTVKMQKI